MSTLSVAVGSPSANTRVGSRSITVSGSVSLSPSSGHSLIGSIGVSVTFGVNGPRVDTSTTSNGTWSVTGSPLAGIRPDSPITIFVGASASLRFFNSRARETDIEDVDAAASVNVQLPGPVPPTLTVNPITSPVLASQLPLPMTFTGSAIGRDAPILLVQYYVEGWPPGSAALFSPTNTGGNFATWSLTLPVPPGAHTITFRALDRFGTAIELSRSFVVQPQPPIVIPPGAGTTITGAPTTSSITSWTRLEPRCADA